MIWKSCCRATPKSIGGSDDAWRCARDEADGWQKPEYDDRDWKQAKVAAKYGEGPWGRQMKTWAGLRRTEFQVPYAAGVPGVVRVIYMPRALAVRVQRLEPDIHYMAYTFDPVSGRRAEVGPGVLGPTRTDPGRPFAARGRMAAGSLVLPSNPGVKP